MIKQFSAGPFKGGASTIGEQHWIELLDDDGKVAARIMIPPDDFADLKHVIGRMETAIAESRRSR